MQTTINLNNRIKVKLTEYGEEVYRQFYYNIPRSAPALKKDDNGYVSFLLWEFIEIFGNDIYMGNKNVIEPLNMIIDIEENRVKHTEAAPEKICGTADIHRFDPNEPWITGKDWAVPYSQIDHLYLGDDNVVYLTTLDHYVWTVARFENEEDAQEGFADIIRHIANPRSRISTFASGYQVIRM